MKTFRSPKTHLKESSIDGNAIFAKEDISKGEIVAVKGGEIIPSSRFAELSQISKSFCLQVEDDFFIGSEDETEIPETGIYINHSCEPNVGIHGQITYVAMRDIQAGEEVLQDYAMSFVNIDAYKDMECACNSDQCRKVLRSNDWERPELQERYRGFFSQYIQEKISKITEA